MAHRENITYIRVRYSETDQMGTFYNARALEWFECGRTEFLRMIGLPYTEIENRGIFMPIVEAHLIFQGRARYDDRLKIVTIAEWVSKVRLRFNEEIVHAESAHPVAGGYTIHAVTGPAGKPLRPPAWLLHPWNEEIQHDNGIREETPERQ